MMRKTLIALFLCVVMVSTIGASVTATACLCVQRLDKPQLVAPENNATIKVGQTVLYEWKAVNGAVAYRLVVEKETAKNVWTIDLPSRIINAPATSYPGRATHAGPHRWCVVAIASDPAQNSQPSEWRTLNIEA